MTQWTVARYGSSETATLAPGLRLVVMREIGTQGGPPPKWRVQVFDGTLKARFDDAGAAKGTAERAAKKWLAAALAELGS